MLQRLSALSGLRMHQRYSHKSNASLFEARKQYSHGDQKFLECFVIHVQVED